ncbi:hypothetical protein BKA70DRAFT_1240445 [Coprinopsis sp. MPI-PUGE-AT-0042]|nr:hypothetical protein BKA70DRAFT_1240445 [Coprinopsis sp. MPI-PUGE-AT-0042]
MPVISVVTQGHEPLTFPHSLHGCDGAAEGPSLFQGAHAVTINGGNFNVGIQHNYPAKNDIEAILKAIPNYRDIHITNLSKATTGTGPHFAEWEEYGKWVAPGDIVKTMWGTGMPGAGKTIFSYANFSSLLHSCPHACVAGSIVINEVEHHAGVSKSRICVTYIYFRYSDHATATVRDFLAVMVKQTVERHPECLPIFDQVYARHIQERSQPSEDELSHLLSHLSELMDVMFCFLDAIDEAPPDVQFDLLQKLGALKVKTFITSRPLPILETRFPDTHRFPILAQDRDLDLHITKEIARSPVLQRILDQRGQALREKIISTIKQKCGGMFLHASLQMDALRDCASVYDVETTLEEFPPQIEGVYARTWSRILDQAPRMAILAKQVLVWVLLATGSGVKVLCARRSLTIRELCYAVARCHDTTHKFDRSRLFDKDMLMGLCYGLLNIEGESQVVRFVHYTAADVVKGLVAETYPYPHSLPALVCIALLTEHGFQRSSLNDKDAFEPTLNATPLLKYAYKTWSNHARAALDDELTATRLATFIQGCRAFPVTKMYCVYWLDTLEPLHTAAYFNILLSFAGSTNLRKPNLPTQGRGKTPLHLAVASRSFAAVRELLPLPRILVNAPDEDGSTPLMEASVNFDQGIMSLLLAHPKLEVNASNPKGRSALMAASERDAAEAVGLLLSHSKIEPNQLNHKGRTALMAASSCASSRALQVLLADPHVKVDLRSSGGKTALDIARRKARLYAGWEEGRLYRDISELLSTYSVFDNHHRPQINQTTSGSPSSGGLLLHQTQLLISIILYRLLYACGSDVNRPVAGPMVAPRRLSAHLSVWEFSLSMAFPDPSYFSFRNDCVSQSYSSLVGIFLNFQICC